MSDSRILHELAGAASLCWSPNPSGVFDSQAACDHVEKALAELRLSYVPRDDAVWRATVDDMLTTAHMVASDDPRESINRLIDWHVQVALDPSVSSDAQALIDRGRKAVREEIYARLCGEAMGGES